MFDRDLHHLQVSAGAESWIDAGQDDAANIGVGIEGLQRTSQLTHQRSGKDVEPFGFVEDDHRSVAAVIDAHAFWRIGVLAGGHQRAVHRFWLCIHWTLSSISLARNTAHAAFAKVWPASGGMPASPPAIQ